jgi:hypothetical protein
MHCAMNSVNVLMYTHFVIPFGPEAAVKYLPDVLTFRALISDFKQRPRIAPIP